MQRIGRRPPPAVMVKPEDALESVRTAMLLGAVLPEMRRRSRRARRRSRRSGAGTRESAGERDGLARDLAGLSAQERNRMALLIEERQRRQSEVEKALEASASAPPSWRGRPTVSRI